MPIVRRMPPRVMAELRRRRFGHPITTLIAIPMIGVIRGATNIAPITTAVESFMMPVAAITAAKDMRAMYDTRRRERSGPSKRILR